MWGFVPEARDSRSDQAKFRATSAAARYPPKNPRFNKHCDAIVVVAKRLAQDGVGMLTEQRCRHGVGDRRHSKPDRLFDVGDRARGRVRDPTDAMARAHLPELKASSTVRR